MIGGDQFFGGEQFGQDAVFGRRIGRRAETDHPIRDQRMHVEKHQPASDDFDHVGDEHDAALGQGIGEGADESGKHNIRQHEEQLQQRRHPLGGMHLRQQRDCCDQQGIIRKRRKKLCRYDGVETAIHPLLILKKVHWPALYHENMAGLCSGHY